MFIDMKYFLLVIGVLTLSGVQTAKILTVFPMAAPSHYILGSSLAKELAEKGHEVTMISPFSEKNPPKNCSYRDIVLTGFLEKHERRLKEMNVFEKKKSYVSVFLPVFVPAVASMIMTEVTEDTLSHPNVQKLINSNETFDVVIMEYVFNYAHMAFARQFNAPLVVFSTLGASSWVNPIVGNPTELSYASEVFFNFPSNMTFLQRAINTLTYVIQQTFNHLYVFPRQKQMIKKYFPNSPYLDNNNYNVSLLLLNSHPSFNQPVPYVPNMIDIGGFHVKPPKKLPSDLQKFLDNSTHGVIYFSLGSHLKSSFLPIEKRQALVNTFSKLKQDVLWKWEEAVLPGQPSNVRLGKWLPQQDILAHPNVKLFITHGGLLSTTETIYHGVPVLAIPIAGDQQLNAMRVENEGFGLKLDLSEISEEALTNKINELLTKSRYAKNAKRKSELFHDRITSPMDTAIYWIEYVTRHRGAPHLRVAALDLPWYKYFLIDVIIVGLSGSLFVLYIFYKMSKKLLSLCCNKTRQKLKSN